MQAAWLQYNGSLFESQPFFYYTGVNIVHPTYNTTQQYLDRIDMTNIKAPHWPPLESLHPCDLQVPCCWPASPVFEVVRTMQCMWSETCGP